MDNFLGAKQEMLLSRIGDNQERRLIMVLLTTARKIDAACADLLLEHSLSEGRFAVLLAVSSEPGVTPGVVAERLQVTRGTVTGLIDGLERHALIMRGGNTDDRRSLTLQVTVAGEELIAAITPQYSKWLHQLASGMSAEDHGGIIRALSTIQCNLGAGAVDD